MRKAFKNGLRSRLYDHMSEYPLLSQFSAGQIWLIARSIVEAHDAEIEEYLDTHKISLREVDAAIKEILQKILLPEIDKLTI